MIQRLSVLQMKYFLSFLSLILGLLITTGCATVSSVVKADESPLTETFRVKAEGGGKPITAEVVVTTLNRNGTNAIILARGLTTPENPLVVTVRKSERDIRVWGRVEATDEKVYIDFPRGINAWVVANAAGGFPGLAVGGVEALTPLGKTHNIKGDVVLSFRDQSGLWLSPVSTAPTVIAPPPSPQVVVNNETALLEAEKEMARLLQQLLKLQEEELSAAKRVPKKVVAETSPPRDVEKSWTLFGRAAIGYTEKTKPAKE